MSAIYSHEVGNPHLPKKLEAVKKHQAHVRRAAVAIRLLRAWSSRPRLHALFRVGRLVALPVPNSIAVLPFVDMSAGKDQEALSDGISEELLDLLAKIRSCR